jgi:hypothetical protein
MKDRRSWKFSDIPWCGFFEPFADCGFRGLFCVSFSHTCQLIIAQPWQYILPSVSYHSSSIHGLTKPPTFNISCIETSDTVFKGSDCSCSLSLHWHDFLCVQSARQFSNGCTGVLNLSLSATTRKVVAPLPWRYTSYIHSSLSIRLAWLWTCWCFEFKLSWPNHSLFCR